MGGLHNPVSDWTWDYITDAASVVGGLSPQHVAEVEALAERLAEAVAVRRIGSTYDPQEAVSKIKEHGEGSILMWFMEDYRNDVLLVLSVQHLGAS